MHTLQKTVAQIRTLESEEIELVGGGLMVCGGESTLSFTTSSISYSYDGHSGSAIVQDDVIDDMYVVYD